MGRITPTYGVYTIRRCILPALVVLNLQSGICLQETTMDNCYYTIPFCPGDLLVPCHAINLMGFLPRLGLVSGI
jgi:hypothetical protein